MQSEVSHTKYAIDRFKLGSEEEVNAADFYGSYIPQKSQRFFCPECGEPVFWRSRGGAQPDKFVHYAKTASSPECDKRVDGRSELNLYERVGLPLALSRSRDSKFRLNIMFPAVGERLIEAAIKQKSKICISADDYSKELPINSTYFQADVTTMIPVAFVPKRGANYTIRIAAGTEIKRKWSDYSDGFAVGGAIFTYDETGGKKIRRGDGISPGKQYYVVSKHFQPNYNEISTKCIGSIQLNMSEYRVYTLSIDVSTNNESRFSLISNYIKTQFGVWLLEETPELIPLWPPVTEQDVLVPVLSTTSIFCAVSSGNAIPKVFTYKANNVSRLPVIQDEAGINTVVLPMYSQEMIVSVDRKYVGREKVFQKIAATVPGFECKIALETHDGEPVDINTLTSPVLAENLLLKSDAKLELYIGSKDKIYSHIPIRDTYTKLPSRRNASEFIFVVENGIIQHYFLQSIRRKEFNEQSLLRQITGNCQGAYVPAPRWIGSILVQWQRNGNFMLATAVRRSIYQGKIPQGLLNLLKTFAKP